MRPLPGAPGVAAAAALLLLLLPRARADEHEHTYQDKEEVVLWMNTVGPYHNRQETYKYFSLPFCVGSKKSISHYHETLGEALQGVELEFSGLDIKFKDDVMPGTYCEIDLDKEKRDAFVYAIKNHYWYQMYIDDLPIWGIVGEADENGEDYYLWTYKKLEIGFNGNRIVDVNLTSEGKVKLVPNTKIQMSYSVKWKKSDVKFEDRFDKYLDPSFFQHRIHWFSIFNSFMMVIFLVGLVSMILMRTLRKDYARYSKEEEMDDMDRDLGDEYGWKQVHGDVFRPSSHPLIFSSLIGSGCQIFAVSLIVIIVAMIEDLYTEYFIFTSFWAYKIYYVYGFMMLVLVILCIVTVCVTIVCTYFLLNAEDYRWMYGLFQTSFYFGYMAVFSTALGIMCGAIGYMGTSAFVRKIYTNVKID
ncbi:hypothetical protein G4228_010485 [Cervus hanglu yarkandensis]|nr:hypothetical protein G4228_010485 [Cervus hanglu yarkandensis]